VQGAQPEWIYMLIRLLAEQQLDVLALLAVVPLG
jgi:hypothetical protein